jgi:hypothetical protein
MTEKTLNKITAIGFTSFGVLSLASLALNHFFKDWFVEYIQGKAIGIIFLSLGLLSGVVGSIAFIMLISRSPTKD